MQLYIFVSYLTANPTVEPTMKVSILSPRDDPNVVFTLSFNVTYGPPSRLYCTKNSKRFINERADPNLSREVIRSQYTSSQPDITRVTLKVETSIREGAAYSCAVTVEGRVNIFSGIYDHDTKGEGVSNVMVTGE